MATPTDPARRAVIRQGLSVAIATGLYGISFGALGVASGLTIWQTCVTSLLLFSGGSQFALIGVLGGGGSVGAAIAASSLLGVRNTLYGLQLTPTMAPRGLWRVPVAQFTIDESTAVSIAQDTLPNRRLGFWVTGIGIYAGWNVMTLVGAQAVWSRRGGIRSLHRAALAAAQVAAAGSSGHRGRRRGRGACARGSRRHPGDRGGRRRRRVRTAHAHPHARRADSRRDDPVTVWIAIIGASLVAFALKFAGYTVPPSFLEKPRVSHITTLLPAALLAALVVMQTFTTGSSLVLDARGAGLAAAIVALLLRAPFIVVVIAAAGTAAALRAFAGWA
jgi:hypothetical protein